MTRPRFFREQPVSGMGAGMNGWELVAAVKREWPNVHFLLATGWGATIDQAEARAKGSMRWSRSRIA
jgi:hypothetical protein